MTPDPDGPANVLEAIELARRLLADFPPPAFFASSVHFPAGCATCFKVAGREYCGAHPSLWAKLPKVSARERNPLFDFEIVDLDMQPRLRAEFFAAMRSATLDLLRPFDNATAASTELG